jgi:hypothetical protein
VGLVAAEHAAAGQPELERLRLDTFEFIADLARQPLVDVADEAERDVIGFAVDPARPEDPPRMKSRSRATSSGISTPVKSRGMAGLLCREGWAVR